MSKILLPILVLALNALRCDAWAPSKAQSINFSTRKNHKQYQFPLQSSPSPSNDAWNGEVVSNTADGKISGCKVEPVGGPPALEWVITIDGAQADLGRFSDTIFKKITADAKRERFQGFRAGTIPPHLLVTYRAFALDECARETVLEAMQQNNIRPFEDARSEFVMENFCIPPLKKKNKKKKVSKKKKNCAVDAEDAPVVVEEEEPEPEWRTFDNMQAALAGGWQPGQSFSFVARKVKGQQVKSDSDVEGSSPLGVGYMNY